MCTIFIVQDQFRGIMRLRQQKTQPATNIPPVAVLPREINDYRFLFRQGFGRGDLVELTFDSGGRVTSIRRPSSSQKLWQR